MKVVIAADKFKGSLSSPEVCRAIARGVRRAVPHARIVQIPLADGGEGTVQALVAAARGRFVTRSVTGPLGQKVRATFGLIDRGRTAVIEMAAASGLVLVPPAKRNPLLTTTFGTGELVAAALDLGVKKIILGIGGSATNDGGAGMATALGARLLDARGNNIRPGGGALAGLDHIDLSTFRFPRSSVQVSIACDVTNPLCGRKGASAVYGPQKGATPSMVKRLDRNLFYYARVVERDVLKPAGRHNPDRPMRRMPGSGAAGGLGFGLCTFLNARLERGIDLVLDHLEFERALQTADLIITGEGSIDEQSLHGKVPVGVALRARKHGVPVIALGGTVPAEADRVFDHGIAGVMSICHSPMTLQEAMDHASKLLAVAARRVLKMALAMKRR